jgi:hypothetical protein
MNKRRPSLTTSGGSFRQRQHNDCSSNIAALNLTTSHSNDTPLYTIGTNTTTAGNAPSRRSKRSGGSSLLSEDRLMSLFLIMLAAWFLYARYQESKLVLPATTHTQRTHTLANEEYLNAFNTNRNLHTTKRDFTSNNNNNGNHTSSSQSNLFPTADDDEISNSKYLRGRESGSGGGFMPQELRELLVMGGVDKGPPPHFSSDHRTNKYRKNTPMQPAEEEVSPSLERLDSSKII